MGRKFVIKPGQAVVLDAGNATAKLQKRSERRAIVDFVIEAGGKATIEEINEHFGYDCRHKVTTLAKVGWFRVEAAPC
jgi:hypothetical protein